MLCYKYEALVASHLEPEAFGRYMAIGTQKNTRGNLLFFEIDQSFRHPFFKMDDIKNRCVPHLDGSPKRSKYISVYRVLEHIELQYFGKLFLVTPDGRALSLEPKSYKSEKEDFGPNLYEELCPVSPLVVSALAPFDFTKFMTEPENPISVPRIFFVDMLLDRDETGRLAGYLPYSDPLHITDCISDLEKGTGKKTKTVSRNSRHHGFFRTIRRGFFLGDQTGMKFYEFPERRVLEVEHARWWRSASESLVS